MNTLSRKIIPTGLPAVIAATLVLAACGTDIEPTQGELKAAWDSSNVPPANYKTDIVAFMRTYLNDPTNVRNAGVSLPTLKRLPNDPGDRFVSCLRYNAKKSDGVYAGNKTGVVVYGSGKLDHFIDAPKVVRVVCDKVVLEPFPELQQLARK